MSAIQTLNGAIENMTRQVQADGRRTGLRPPLCGQHPWGSCRSTRSRSSRSTRTCGNTSSGVVQTHGSSSGGEVLIVERVRAPVLDRLCQRFVEIEPVHFKRGPRGPDPELPLA